MKIFKKCGLLIASLSGLIFLGYAENNQLDSAKIMVISQGMKSQYDVVFDFNKIKKLYDFTAPLIPALNNFQHSKYEFQFAYKQKKTPFYVCFYQNCFEIDSTTKKKTMILDDVVKIVVLWGKADTLSIGQINFGN
jgi:hypothetical protein